MTPEELAHVVSEYQQQCDEGHTRLRGDFREFHDRTEMALALQRTKLELLTHQLETVSQANPDVMKLRFSSSVVASIVFVTVSLVGTGYAASSRVLNRIDVMSAKIGEQSEKDKVERANIAKLYDERNARYERSIDTLTRQVEALKYEQQRLREELK